MLFERHTQNLRACTFFSGILVWCLGNIGIAIAYTLVLRLA